MSSKIDYAWPVTSENGEVYNKILSKLDTLEGAFRGKRLVIMGAGIRGCCLLKMLEERGFSEIVFADNNEEKQGNLIYGYDILSFEDARDYDGEQVFLVAPEDAGKICAQLQQAGLEEEKDWFSFSASAFDSYIEEYVRKLDDYLLVMGDCGFTHIALGDKVNDSLGMMIKSEVGERRCKVLSMHGMGQQAYYHIAKSLLERGEHPTAFLLLLMTETLAPKVPIMPRTQHPVLIRKLVENSENPNPEFVAYAHLTQERFDRFQVEDFSARDDSSFQLKEKLHMEMSYLFRYRESTEGVIYLKKLVQMLNENDIPVIFYVPPVNYHQGEVLFGKQFKEMYRNNYLKLYETLDAEGLKYDVVDTSYLLQEEDFAASNTVDETCNYFGRRKIIQYLRQEESLKEYMAGDKKSFQ